ncbi:hypothetical protein ACHAPJ_010697 [Fusarium lateritium]
MTEILPHDMGDWWTTSVNYPDYDNIIQIDASTMEVNGYQLGRFPDDQPGEHPRSMIVCRQNFRSWMVQKLPVQTNKQLSHYEENASGVTAYFKDGSNAHGTILVGADGASSAVRRQLLGITKRELHPFVPICGSFMIKGEPLQRLQALSSASVVTANADVLVMLSPLEMKTGCEEARYWWVVTFRSQDPEVDTNWVHSASEDVLYSKVMKIVEGMPEFTVDALKIAGPSGVWNPQIRFSEYVAPTTLPEGRVTLMGDAAHNTTPYGGMGANTGIKDAANLGRLLSSQKWDSLEDIQHLLQRYNSVMLPRGRQVVLSSRAVGVDDSFGMDSDSNADIIPWHETITTCKPGISLEEFEKDSPTAAPSTASVSVGR